MVKLWNRSLITYHLTANTFRTQSFSCETQRTVSIDAYISTYTAHSTCTRKHTEQTNFLFLFIFFLFLFLILFGPATTIFCLYFEWTLSATNSCYSPWAWAQTISLATSMCTNVCVFVFVHFVEDSSSSLPPFSSRDGDVVRFDYLKLLSIVAHSYIYIFFCHLCASEAEPTKIDI